MVIVDTRSTGGRGETGIPTDAYFAVEEIRDVSGLLDFAVILCDRYGIGWKGGADRCLMNARSLGRMTGAGFLISLDCTNALR